MRLRLIQKCGQTSWTCVWSEKAQDLFLIATFISFFYELTIKSWIEVELSQKYFIPLFWRFSTHTSPTCWSYSLPMDAVCRSVSSMKADLSLVKHCPGWRGKSQKIWGPQGSVCLQPWRLLWGSSLNFLELSHKVLINF